MSWGARGHVSEVVANPKPATKTKNPLVTELVFAVALAFACFLVPLVQARQVRNQVYQVPASCDRIYSRSWLPFFGGCQRREVVAQTGKRFGKRDVEFMWKQSGVAKKQRVIIPLTGEHPERPRVAQA